MTPAQAVTRGHILITLPVLVITAAAVVAMAALDWFSWWSPRVIIGAALGWVWWSFTIPRWRDWVEDCGLRPEDVQPLAQKTGLVWPSGFFFERTELKRRNGRRGW